MILPRVITSAKINKKFPKSFFPKHRSEKNSVLRTHRHAPLSGICRLLASVISYAPLVTSSMRSVSPASRHKKNGPGVGGHWPRTNRWSSPLHLPFYLILKYTQMVGVCQVQIADSYDVTGSYLMNFLGFNIYPFSSDCVPMHCLLKFSPVTRRRANSECEISPSPPCANGV